MEHGAKLLNDSLTMTGSNCRPLFTTKGFSHWSFGHFLFCLVDATAWSVPGGGGGGGID